MSDLVQAIGPQGFGTYAVRWTDSGPELTPAGGEAGQLLAPGFVDIHIHGAFGIDFMTASRAEMERLCDLLSKEGYEAFLPTTVTASEEDVLASLERLPSHPMILGFHLEGPFISRAHPGAQPISSIVSTPEGDAWKAVLEHPQLKVITLAPELPGILPMIERLYQRGVRVSMGHSDATFGQAAEGAKAGADHTTHTFNAMRGFHHRESGLAGFALLSDPVYAELIYDRIHVSRQAAELLIRSKPMDKLVAVSDSTLATGLPPGEKVRMWGHECVTAPGEVRLASNGALAGSAITLLDAFRNLWEDFGAETAIRACCLNPRLSIGLNASPRKWLLFDANLSLVEMFSL